MRPIRAVPSGPGPLLFALLASGVFLIAAAPARASLTEIRSEPVVSGLDQPMFVTAPAGDARLFVVERAGRILIVSHDGVQNLMPFLDLRGQVATDGERGLFSVAFAPDFEDSGFFFVMYNDLTGASVLSRFSLAADEPDRADPAETVLLTIPQPFPNHNGGTLAFGADGFLYLSAGDGGSGNDPGERAQDPGELLGKMLRLDVGVPATGMESGSAGTPTSSPIPSRWRAPAMRSPRTTRSSVWPVCCRRSGPSVCAIRTASASTA